MNRQCLSFEIEKQIDRVIGTVRLFSIGNKLVSVSDLEIVTVLLSSIQERVSI
jgi:hypothetical protein